MIIQGEIIDQPYAGQFDERIYDNANPWNSSHWSWVKFLTSDYSEWVGHFRGNSRGIAISKKINQTIVLTSDYIFRLDNQTGNAIEIENQPQYHSLMAAPDGTFIFVDYYTIERLSSDLKTLEPINAPIQMDMIKFLRWSDHKLLFTCEEFLNHNSRLEMELDSNDWTVKFRDHQETDNN